MIKFIGTEAQIGHVYIATNRALSGQNKSDKMKNIYDLEGNFFEWTTESYSNDKRARLGSNSSYAAVGNFVPASYREDLNPTIFDSFGSSRSTLYL